MSNEQTAKISVSDRPLANRIVKGGSWALLSKVLTYPAGLVLTMLLARLLSPEAMGGYFLSTSLIAIALAIVQMGMGWTSVKLIAKALAKTSHLMARQVVQLCIASVLISSMLAAVTLIFFGGDWLLGSLDNGEYLRSSLVWIGLLVVSMAMMELFAEVLRGLHDLRGTSLLVDQLMQRMLLVLVFVIFWFFELQLTLDEVLMYSFFAASLAALTGTFMIRANLATIGDSGERIRVIEIFKLGPPFMMMRVNNWLLNIAGIWVLGMFRPIEEVAIFGAANIISSLVLAPQMLMNGIGAPVIVELFHKQRNELLEQVIRAAGFFALLPALILTFLLVVIGNELLIWVYGIDYNQGATVMAVLAVGRCLAVFCGIPSITLAMTNHQNTILKLMTVMSMLTFAGYFSLAEQAGALGIAIVMAVSIAMQNLLLVFLVKKHVGVITLPALSPKLWQRFVQELFKRKLPS